VVLDDTVSNEDSVDIASTMSLLDEGKGAGIVLDEDSSLLDATLLVGITEGVLECTSAEEVVVAALSKLSEIK
jgi:hypothetical protein